MSDRDELRGFVVGPIETNCYAYVSEGKALVVDPGASGARIAEALSDVEVTAIVATHGHHDHVCGAAALKEATGAEWLVSEKDAWRVTQALKLSSRVFALPDNPEERDAPKPDRTLSEGDSIEVGSARFRVIETPGHTEGGIVLVGEGTAAGVAFMGDTLFKGSCGRTDLMGGDGPTLARSLARLAAELPGECALYCGHGEPTTMAYELATNPYLQTR